MKRSKYIAVVATTIDGKIAAYPGQFTDWTSPEDKAFLQWLLNKSDVIVVGNTTYRVAEKPLTNRACIVLTRSVSRSKQARPNLLLVNPSRVRLKKLLERHKAIAILGGTQTYTYCLEHNMLDELYVTIEPLVFGKGLSLFELKGFRSYAFDLVSVRRLNDRGSLLLRYRRNCG